MTAVVLALLIVVCRARIVRPPVRLSGGLADRRLCHLAHRRVTGDRNFAYPHPRFSDMRERHCSNQSARRSQNDQAIRTLSRSR